jgi:hypothetical protein
MILPTGLVAINGCRVQDILSAARDQGLDVYLISTPPGSEVRDFFGTVRSEMPLDPPVMTDNWDALLDSLCAGLAESTASGVVVIWPDARNLRDSALDGFEVAMTSLARVSDQVGNPDWTENPKGMWVYVDLDAGRYGTFPYSFVVRSQNSF